jgi:hypothetical protein
MAQAELNAVVCSGARRDKQFTYALLDERAQNSTVLSREESLAALARRYFVSRGPATVHDFSTWSGLTITDCKLGIHLNKDLLENADADNKTYYFSNQLIPGNRNGSRIFFLPPYDEYIMGYKDRSAILRYKNSILINPPLLFYFYCMIVYDGQIVGTWKRTPEKNRILLEYVLFDKTADHKEELEKVIRRFSEFNEMVVQHN